MTANGVAIAGRTAEEHKWEIAAFFAIPNFGIGNFFSKIGSFFKVGGRAAEEATTFRRAQQGSAALGRGLSGAEFEAYLVARLGGKGSFNVAGREFDGAYGFNNAI